MPALREVQAAFSAAMLGGDSAALAAFILPNRIAPSSRLAIYRNNVRENFHAALQAGFPVLHRLVGPDYFRQMAWAYQRRHPSPSGNLFHVGRNLASFLEKTTSGTAFAYLADVARLEWLCQESTAADDAGPLALQQLSRLSPGDYARLRFGLHPSVRMMRSRYPVMRIWQVNQAAGDDVEPVDLDSGPDELLIRCAGNETELRRLAPGDYAFLDALAAGRMLADAHEVALGRDPEFSLEPRLRAWVSLNVICRFFVL